MATVREYSRQFNTPSMEVGGRRASGEDFGAEVAQAQIGFGRQVSETAAVFDQLENQREIADAQLKMVQAETYATTLMKDLQTEAKPGEPIADRVRTGMNDYFAALGGEYNHKGARNYVNLYGAGMTQKFTQSAIKFDVDLTVQDKFAKRTEIMEANKRMALADPSSYSETKKRLEFEATNGIGVWGVPDPTNPRVVEASDSQVRKGIQEIAWSAAMGTLQNPVARGMFAGVASQLNPTQGSIVDKLIQREGGYVADDAGRGPTKFGINQQANPDIDVSKLTEAQAAKLYTDRYWNKYGVGDLPASVQNIVMDGVVNHRAVFAEQLANAAKSGATADQLAQMRASEYDRLIASNPDKYSKSRESWMKRVADTAAQPAAATEDTPISTEIKNAPEWYNDLGAEQQVSFLRMAEQQSKRERGVADSARRKTMQDHEAYIAQTGQLPPNPLPDKAFTDPGELQTYKSMLTAGQIVSDVMDAPLAKQQELLTKLTPTYDPESVAPGVYDKQVQIAQNAQRMLDQAMKLRQKDQMAFAYQHKFSTDNPIEQIQIFDVDNIIPQLTQRIPQAEAVAAQYGQPMKPLMDGEATAMAKYVSTLSTPDKMNYMKGLSGSLTLPQYNSVVKQVWKDNNPVQFVGKLMTNEGAMQNNQTAPQIAQTILLGQQAMEYRPAGAEGQAERGFKGVMPNFADVRQQVGEYMKGVKVPEASVGQISEVVMTHYIGAMLQKGTAKNFEIGEKDTGNRAVFEQSLKTVLGSVSTVGNEKVLRPFGVGDTQFQQAVRDRVGAIDPTLRGYGLAIADGENNKYLVTTGNQPRFIIDLNSPVPEPVRRVTPPPPATTAAPQPVPAGPGPLGSYRPFRIGGNS
jgi:hypothetical protein